MADHLATIIWRGDSTDFADNTYTRVHEWHFDGGTVVRASAAPSIVPLPMSNAQAVDPEEALVASVASCHMLFFLSFAQQAGYALDGYSDAACGVLGKDAKGTVWMSRIDLYPQMVWSGTVPPHEEIEKLHHAAHDACFIANSLRTEIVTNLTG